MTTKAEDYKEKKTVEEVLEIIQKQINELVAERERILARGKL